ncbi:retropepsin-like aspartic protease [Hymenobacter caeli]|uniref:Aspartyl protease n=1 Tax=Hymenobacter caeli TaxID=2735894 RepID=A0ABX2FR12_9BACT|nr:retropepsin-like aspartic protease [Hymenobacter caeli]NRT19372.1 putative aspartyl protease [Hymenobacter caeli]
MRATSFLTLWWGLVVATTLTAPAQPIAATDPQPRRLEATPVFQTAFELVGGLIILRNLTLNGRQGDFVLDTGCSTALLVDSGPFAGQLTPLREHATAHGTTGTVAIKGLPVTNFQLGAARYTGFAAHAFSLEHLRRYAGPRLLGVIGYGLLRDYEVVIDYPRRRVYWYTLRTKKPAPRPFARQDSLAFVVVRGGPIVTGTIGAVQVRLLLDTGAVNNDLDAAFCQRLAPREQPTRSGAEFVTGSDGHQQVAQRGTLPTLVLENITWKAVPVLILPHARPISGRELAYQGVLGFPFLSQDQVVSFHFGRQQLYALVPVTPRK